MANIGNILRKIVDIQFWIFVLLGWYFSEKFHNLYSFDEKYTLQSCPQCPEKKCLSCKEIKVNENNIKIRNERVANSFYRQYPFKPSNVNEDMLSRWKVVTPKYQYEMINGEPRIGLNGMWRLEKEEIEKSITKKIIKDIENLPVVLKNINVKSILRKTDSFSGTRYLAKIQIDKTLKDDAGSSLSHLSSMEIQKPFINGKPKLRRISVKNYNKFINIISPISGVTERFQRYLDRMKITLEKSSKLEEPLIIKLIFVIFEAENSPSSEAISVIEGFRNLNPTANIEIITLNGVFNRAIGLHHGVTNCKDDDLMLFMDVDLDFGVNFLTRVLANTIQHKTVFFPVVFSQYDPTIVDLAANKNAIPKDIKNHKHTINVHTGFWMHYAFGIVSVHKSDYLNAGGFKLDIEGWGGEDVDLYKKFIAKKGLTVMSSVEPDLTHVYHSRGCDPTLSPEQYKMCIGSWADSLASKREIASVFYGPL